MEMENRFFNKIPSLDDLQEITSFENSFKKDPENKTTIGGMVVCIYMTYHRVCNKINTTGATSGAGSAYPSGAPEHLYVL